MVGMGSIGQRHVRNLRTLLGSSVEISAYRVRKNNVVLNSKLETVPEADLEEAYNLRLVDSLEAGLAEKPDVVFVTNPNHMHLETALAAAKAGCDLFIEKPVSHQEEGLSSLLQVVEEKGLKCVVGYQLRFHPGFQKLQSLLNEQAVGTLLSAEIQFGEFIPNWHPYEDFRGYHAARKDQGGGALLSQIHDLDCAIALFGSPRRLVAMGGSKSFLNLEVEDTVDIQMECERNGKTFPVHIHQDYLQNPPNRFIRIVGDRGVVTWDYFQNKVTWVKAGGEKKEFTFAPWERNQMFMDELKNLLGVLQKKEVPVVSLQEACGSLRIALAAQKSLATSEQVVL